MYNELSKRLRAEEKEYVTLSEQEQELRGYYEQYLKVLEELKQKEKIIESLRLIIEHTPKETPKRNYKKNKDSIQYDEVLDYIHNLLQTMPLGANNKDIKRAIEAGLSLQVKGQKLFREMAKDNRFMKVDKHTWKLANVE